MEIELLFFSLTYAPKEGMVVVVVVVVGVGGGQ